MLEAHFFERQKIVYQSSFDVMGKHSTYDYYKCKRKTIENANENYLF